VSTIDQLFLAANKIRTEFPDIIFRLDTPRDVRDQNRSLSKLETLEMSRARRLIIRGIPEDSVDDQNFLPGQWDYLKNKLGS
jgi:hypothetical protein